MTCEEGEGETTLRFCALCAARWRREFSIFLMCVCVLGTVAMGGMEEGLTALGQGDGYGEVNDKARHQRCDLVLCKSRHKGSQR